MFCKRIYSLSLSVFFWGFGRPGDAVEFQFFWIEKKLEQKQESEGKFGVSWSFFALLFFGSTCSLDSWFGSNWHFVSDLVILQLEMAGAMKAMKVMKAKKVSTAKVMTKGGLTGELANSTELKKADISTILNTLAEIGTKEVKKSGKFVLPGLVMIKTREKPAKKAGKKVMFGKEIMVKAQPAKTVVKAFPVSSLKNAIWGSLKPRFRPV